MAVFSFTHEPSSIQIPLLALGLLDQPGYEDDHPRRGAAVEAQDADGRSLVSGVRP
jgi:hypothetical protein